jgi:hypothetical protein
MDSAPRGRHPIATISGQAVVRQAARADALPGTEDGEVARARQRNGTVDTSAVKLTVWEHDLEAELARCEGNSTVTGHPPDVDAPAGAARDPTSTDANRT